MIRQNYAVQVITNFDLSMREYLGRDYTSVPYLPVPYNTLEELNEIKKYHQNIWAGSVTVTGTAREILSMKLDKDMDISWFKNRESDFVTKHFDKQIFTEKPQLYYTKEELNTFFGNSNIDFDSEYIILVFRRPIILTPNKGELPEMACSMLKVVYNKYTVNGLDIWIVKSDNCIRDIFNHLSKI